MHATDVHSFADIGHLRLEKERAMELMRTTGQLSDGCMQTCLQYHREVLRRMEGSRDRDVLQRHFQAIKRDFKTLDNLRERLMLLAAQERDPITLEKTQVFLAALEGLMRAMKRILDMQAAQQWTYLDRRNPAMARPPAAEEQEPKKKPKKNENQKQDH